jgi:hypothetical protein
MIANALKSQTSEHQACELLCLLQLCRLTDEQRERCASLASQLSFHHGWEWFFKTAKSNSAIVLTSDRLQELGISQPEDFKTRAQGIRTAANERAEHAHRILTEASKNGIEVIVLKGGLLGSVLYKDPAYKKMNDIDILVHFDQAQPMLDILKNQGLMSVGALFDQEEISQKSHHSPPFVTPDLKCMVGVHWGLTSPDSRWKPNYGLIWKQRQPATVFGANAFRMSWEENLLHLCIHLPFFKIGARELSDVYNLVLFSEPVVDWNLFNGLVQLWKAEDAAWRVLSLTSAVHELGVPKNLLNQWRMKSGSFTIKDTESRTKLGCALIATRSVQIGRIEKAFAIFKLTESYSEKVFAWAMTWILTFWPKRSEIAPITGVLSLPSLFDRCKARLKSLTYCWRAMAREYGTSPLIAITVLNIFSVIKASVLRPLGHHGKSIRQNPHYKILEMLE